MSRDLEKAENATFSKIYGTGDKCRKCGSADVTIKIWEAYDSPAKQPGGDIGADTIVAAVVVCEKYGHGEVVSYDQIRGTSQAA